MSERRRLTKAPPPPAETLDLDRLLDLVQSALVMHGELPAAEARELAEALIRRSRKPQSDPEA